MAYVYVVSRCTEEGSKVEKVFANLKDARDHIQKCENEEDIWEWLNWAEWEVIGAPYEPIKPWVSSTYTENRSSE